VSIQTQSVSYSYPGGINALRDVTLQIQTGELVAIMGENGAGKTTLVKHFNGLLKPTNGLVLVNGIDTKRIHVAKLSFKVGMVFQNPDHQIFAKNVSAEIAFGLNRFNLYRLQAKKRIDEVAKRLSLEESLDQSPFALSVGDRKRVTMASVLAWNPDILILDEPTIGQDALLQINLRHLIQSLHEEGKTVIMVTHDVEFVAELKPRVIMMHEGKVIADGPAAKILTDPSAVEQASLTLPQISQILTGFDGLKHELLDLEEAVSVIRKGTGGAS
jgi:energy-coupling factor transport system ATP-binding protein